MVSTVHVDDIWEALTTVMDPEIPVISLVEMGIIREVNMDDSSIHVTMTPTFSGCPALVEMETAIHDTLLSCTQLEANRIIIHKQLNPPWTSDWITDEGRRKLKAFGLQPPDRHGGNVLITLFDEIACPRCDSTQTTMKNSFGSTLCRAIWYCENCQEPFEQFKAL
ncbi:MAG: 1,2-phenylacetyl-CoA epoxidase subunit PaaD [Chloroflexota bacterium]